MPVTPPPFEPVIDCMQVQIFARFVLSGSVAMLTPNVGMGGHPAYSDCEAVAGLVYDWLNTTLLPLTSASWNVFRLKVFSREVEDGALFDEAVDLFGMVEPTPGSTEQAQWAPLLLTGSGKRGYGEHGRIFNLAPVPDQVTYTGYQNTYLLSLVDAWKTLATNLQGNDPAYDLGIARESKGNIVPIRAWAFSPKLTVQDRRRHGFGE